MPAAAAAQPLPTVESDAMRSALVQRADVLEGCTVGSDEEAELKAIVHHPGRCSALRLNDGK